MKNVPTHGRNVKDAPSREYPFPAGLFPEEAEKALDDGVLQARSIKDGPWFDLTRAGPTKYGYGPAKQYRAVSIPFTARCSEDPEPYSGILYGRHHMFEGLSMLGMQGVGYQWTQELRRKENT